MIDTQTEAVTCLGCGRPLEPSKGPRKRLYHNAACKMRARRAMQERKEREAAQTEMRARWSGLEPEIQQVLEDVMNLHSVGLASRVAIVIRTAINQLRLEQQNLQATLEKLSSAGARIQKLERQVEVQRSRIGELTEENRTLRTQLDQARDIEEAFSTDTGVHSFKKWLVSHRYHAERPGCKKLMAMVAQSSGSRGIYTKEMRMNRFTRDEESDVWDAWRAMLRDERFKSYYASKSNQS